MSFFTPYDQYNQNPNQQYMRPAGRTIDETQRSALAAALRQGPMQAQQYHSSSPISPEMAMKIVGMANNWGQNGIPNGSQNEMINSITPDFASANYGAPTMNMTGANNITPNFRSMNFQSPAMEQGFNPAMFGGMF